MTDPSTSILRLGTPFGLGVLLLLLMAPPSSAQTATPNQAPPPRAWTVAIYPVIGWLPLFGASLDVPAVPEIPGDGGASVTVDSSWDSAYLAGGAVQTRRFMAEGGFLWAGLSASLDAPRVSLESDLIYGEAFAGPRVTRDLAIVGGVRHIGLKVVAKIGDRPTFERKPGVWDPLVGVDYRKGLGRSWNLQTTVLGGGFGVGTDLDVSARFKADWNFVPHVGVSLGYQVLYFKLSQTVLEKAFTISQTLHGPVVGVGVYF
ncbi:MAG TPA: hypothetical protein VIY56_07925 [Vicinamibacterales bacterium]